MCPAIELKQWVEDINVSLGSWLDLPQPRSSFLMACYEIICSCSFQAMHCCHNWLDRLSQNWIRERFGTSLARDNRDVWVEYKRFVTKQIIMSMLCDWFVQIRVGFIKKSILQFYCVSLLFVNQSQNLFMLMSSK